MLVVIPPIQCNKHCAYDIIVAAVGHIHTSPQIIQVSELERVALDGYNKDDYGKETMISVLRC